MSSMASSIRWNSLVAVHRDFRRHYDQSSPIPLMLICSFESMTSGKRHHGTISGARGSKVSRPRNSGQAQRVQSERTLQNGGAAYRPDNRKLRELGESVLTVYKRNGFSDLTLDWRQPALTVVPRYDAARAAEAGISRSDIYQALSFGTDGIRVGVFRDRDMMLPIIVRAPESERNDLQRVRDRTVFSPALGAFIPMRQVIDGFDLSTEETMLRRLDRIPTLRLRPISHLVKILMPLLTACATTLRPSRCQRAIP